MIETQAVGKDPMPSGEVTTALMAQDGSLQTLEELVNRLHRSTATIRFSLPKECCDKEARKGGSSDLAQVIYQNVSRIDEACERLGDIVEEINASLAGMEPSFRGEKAVSEDLRR